MAFSSRAAGQPKRSREGTAPQWWPTAGIALATPFLVWFAIGEPPTYAIYRFGPYDIGQQAGHIAGIVAAIVAQLR